MSTKFCQKFQNSCSADFSFSTKSQKSNLNHEKNQNFQQKNEEASHEINLIGAGIKDLKICNLTSKLAVLQLHGNKISSMGGLESAPNLVKIKNYFFVDFE